MKFIRHKNERQHKAIDEPSNKIIRMNCWCGNETCRFTLCPFGLVFVRYFGIGIGKARVLVMIFLLLFRLQYSYCIYFFGELLLAFPKFFLWFDNTHKNIRFYYNNTVLIRSVYIRMYKVYVLMAEIWLILWSCMWTEQSHHSNFSICIAPSEKLCFDHCGGNNKIHPYFCVAFSPGEWNANIIKWNKKTNTRAKRHNSVVLLSLRQHSNTRVYLWQNYS